MNPDTTAATFPAEKRSYSVGGILGVWTLATLPMVVLAWIVMPALARRVSQPPVILYWLLMSSGMLWLFVLALNIIRREEGNLRWSVLTRYLRLNAPLSRRTGQPRRLLFCWLLPCLVIALASLLVQVAMMTVAHSFMLWQFDFRYAQWVSRLWPTYANLIELVSPQYAGQAWICASLMALWLFGSLAAEELLFRGVLLPRMERTFGRFDWFANGMLYVGYSVFQPWMLPLRLLDVLTVVWPVRRFRSLMMGLIVRCFGAVGLLAVLWIGFYEAPLKPLHGALHLPYICRNPQPVDYKSLRPFRTPLAELPKFDPVRPWFSVDLRSRDLSRLDLRNSIMDLEHANYDAHTTWPSAEKMPRGFDPAQIVELGKNPGLGIRKLHARGIKGRGIGIGIVDMLPLTRHSEFAGQLKWYEEINRWGDSPAHMHGTAVSSIAVGKTTGVAPGADLYFISINDNARMIPFILHYYAQGVRRLLEINRLLPRDRRIRAISLSFGPGPCCPGFEDFAAAIREAEAEGIYVAWCGEGRFRISGLAIRVMADRDDFQSYSIPQWIFRRGLATTPERLFVPMDSRTVASPTGADDYVFYGPGGASWTVPFAAGAFALAAQVDPEITPEQFWALAIKTGRHIRVNHEDRTIEIGPILDMQAVIAELTKRQPEEFWSHKPVNRLAQRLVPAAPGWPPLDTVQKGSSQPMR